MGLELYRTECVVPVLPQRSRLWLWPSVLCPRWLGRRSQGEVLALSLSSCVALTVVTDHLAEHLRLKQQAGLHSV